MHTYSRPFKIGFYILRYSRRRHSNRVGLPNISRDRERRLYGFDLLHKVYIVLRESEQVQFVHFNFAVFIGFAEIKRDVEIVDTANGRSEFGVLEASVGNGYEQRGTDAHFDGTKGGRATFEEGLPLERGFSGVEIATNIVKVLCYRSNTGVNKALGRDGVGWDQDDGSGAADASVELKMGNLIGKVAKKNRGMA